MAAAAEVPVGVKEDCFRIKVGVLGEHVGTFCNKLCPFSKITATLPHLGRVRRYHYAEKRRYAMYKTIFYAQSRSRSVKKLLILIL